MGLFISVFSFLLHHALLFYRHSDALPHKIFASRFKMSTRRLLYTCSANRIIFDADKESKAFSLPTLLKEETGEP
jgi:regulatory protein YycH of two-component signal transduction system YycFG